MKDAKIGTIATFDTKTGEGTIHVNGEIYFFDADIMVGFKRGGLNIYDNMRISNLIGEDVDVLIVNGTIEEIFV